jgi:glycosyltransferase involved in cell wall biosynthesis/GT2 family glycosyltransferase
MITHRNPNPTEREVPVRVSVVIATLCRPESLAVTLETLAACDPAPHEIIIADGDPDASARSLAEGVGVDVTYLPASLGLTRQRNLGAAAATGDVVLFLDDDVLIPPDTFRLLAQAYCDSAVVGATGRVLGDRSRLVKRESRLRRWLPGGGRQGAFTRHGYPRYVTDVNQTHDVEYMLGCFMSARRDLVLELGFDESLVGYAVAEDEDFSCRLSGRGRIRYLPEIVVEHRLAPHTDVSSRALNRVLVVNRAYLFRKNFVRTPLARSQFAFLVGLLGVHRLAVKDVAGARGIAEGAVAAIRSRRSPARSPGKDADVAVGSVPVAFVSSHARDGGSEQHLQWLLEAIDPAWVRLVVSLEEGLLPRRSRALGHPTVVIATGTRYADLAVSAWRLRRAVVRTRPKVVHASGVKAAAVAVLATVATGIPVVWLKVDFSLDGWISALIARRCAQVVGVSQAVLRTFGPELADRLHVVHNGVPDVEIDRGRGRALAVERFGETAPRRLVTLVGRLDPGKGQDELIEIAPDVLARAPDTGFLLIGGSDLASPYCRHLLARIEELGLQENVRLLGHQQDVRDVISGCDVLVHASLPVGEFSDTEGFPLVALEAMMAGTPVVGYDNGGMPELVGDCGRIVPRGDRAQLADAILVMLEDAALWERSSACGRERVATRFRLADNLEGLLSRYRAACP